MEEKISNQVKGCADEVDIADSTEKILTSHNTLDDGYGSSHSSPHAAGNSIFNFLLKILLVILILEMCCMRGLLDWRKIRIEGKERIRSHDSTFPKFHRNSTSVVQ